ncbi:hypothetical protein H5410_021647 [Solanum commersonii]|uniref:Uncharacterized protein n=1 Tax=Solanum commersonii TaxID=4109 RepID=A0A9J5ZHT8_SOLCO|nr:hypothetical protein H5410_021647 [Solanum commersonii]
MAFLKGRQIMDAALIANECIDSTQREKNKDILKDMGFDMKRHNEFGTTSAQSDSQFSLMALHRVYLLARTKMGIWYCTSTVRSSFLINGSPQNGFTTQKGIGQELDQRSQSKQWVTQLPVSLTSVLATVLGCNTDSLPTIYLGLPLGVKLKSYSIWQCVTERCELKALSDWKNQYLSFGGHLILINSDLDFMPTYAMAMFWFSMPLKVEKRLDRLRSDFFQQVNKASKTLNLVRWDIVILKKERRTRYQEFKGAGFNFEGTSFWRKSTTEKYDLLNEWSSNMGCPPQGVAIWRNIRDLWPAFSANIGIKVGNGSKVSFWKDTKIRHSPLKDQFPICFTIARDTNLTEAQRKEGEELEHTSKRESK